MMLAFIGPDMTGKSNIAEALSLELDIPVFKNQNEWKAKLDSDHYYRNLLRFGGTFLMDFLCQVTPEVILDRFYPCEFVYSQIFDRKTDDDIIFEMDRKFALSGGKFIFCKRRSYDGLVDDLFPDMIGPEQLYNIELVYKQFLEKTHCEFLVLETDDMDLEGQLFKIKKFLGVER